MDLAEVLREAIEAQILDHEPTQAAVALRGAVDQFGAVDVADGLLDSAAVALRRLVVETDEALPLDELVERLTLDGAVPGDSASLLAHMLTLAAATAGGIRTSARESVEQIGAERALSGAWLATLAAIRVVAISLEQTEANIADDVLQVLHSY